MPHRRGNEPVVKLEVESKPPLRHQGDICCELDRVKLVEDEVEKIERKEFWLSPRQTFLRHRASGEYFGSSLPLINPSFSSPLRTEIFPRLSGLSLTASLQTPTN